MSYILCPRTPSSAFRNLFWTNRTTISPPVHEFFYPWSATFSGAPIRALEYSRICMCCLDKSLLEYRIAQFFVEAIDTVIEWFEHVNRVSQTRVIRSEKCATFIDFGIELARRIRFGASKRQKALPVWEFWTIRPFGCRLAKIAEPVGMLLQGQTQPEP